MSLHRWAVALVLAAASTTAALASTAASLKLTGDGVDLDLSIDTSAATFDVGNFDIALAPGETLHETFSYTVRVTDDGTAAARRWQFCTPLFQSDCGPAATGFEQSYASIWIGRDPRDVGDDNYWIDDSMIFDSFQSVTGSPGLYTGTLDYFATNTSTYMPQFTTVTVMGAVFADVSAVPEPATAWLAAFGLGLLAVGRAKAARPGRRPALAAAR